jgi:hypothetical protein
MSIEWPCTYCGRTFHTYPSCLQRTPSPCCSPSCAAHLRFPVSPIAPRFWRQVDRSAGAHACWPWLGRKNPAGYGVFYYKYQGKNRNTSAPRMAYELTYGLLLPGFEACHNCPHGDNPRCCNPGHLFPGTQSMNNLDAYDKGRAPRGEQHSFAKLTAHEVRAIRSFHGTMSMQKLAKQFHVDVSTIWEICHRRIWRHIA